VRLLAASAVAADPGFALSPANCAAVSRICRAAGGVPLAIELAAAGARDGGTESVASYLEARLRAGGIPAVPAPSEAVGAAIGWSYDLLNPAEQVLLRRLSVFAGWSLEMAERVCSDKLLPAGRVAGLLAGLARRGLVEPEPQPDPAWPALPGTAGHDRYRMPGAVRDFAAGCLTRAGESEMTRRRLRDYAARLAEYMTSLGMARVPSSWPVLKQVFRSYNADAGNFRAVLDWCLEHGDTETGLRICCAVQLCWLVRGAQAEGEYWLDAFLGADLAAVPAAVRGPALVCLLRGRSVRHPGRGHGRAGAVPGGPGSALDRGRPGPAGQGGAVLRPAGGGPAPGRGGGDGNPAVR
jgi:predicted ATPase